MKKFKGLSCILLIDDDAPTNYLHRKVIERSGIIAHIQVATGGTEALEYLTSTGRYSHQTGFPQPGIIFLDINMPGMSGLELLRRVRMDYSLPPPPVIMMITAYGDAPSYQQAMADGANDFLSKPIDFTQLKDKINQLIG